jgi:diacylglycerol kinase family enzyme
MVNKKAAQFNLRAIRKMTSSIKRRGDSYTVLEPTSAGDLLRQVEAVAGLKKRGRGFSEQFARRGKVTALVACGGDGTFNLVSRVAMKVDLPVGVLPMGQYNNIVRSLFGSDNCDDAITRTLGRKTRKIDSGTVSGQVFFGSLGFGFIPELSRLLSERKPPRFAFVWSQIGMKAAAARLPKDIIIKVDSFRFEISPTILSVNLLPYTLGLPFSPASIADDARAEIIFDAEVSDKLMASYLRAVAVKQFVYGSQIRSFRGQTMSVQPMKGCDLYLDGELVTVPAAVVDIHIGEKQLKVLG